MKNNRWVSLGSAAAHVPRRSSCRAPASSALCLIGLVLTWACGSADNALVDDRSASVGAVGGAGTGSGASGGSDAAGGSGGVGPLGGGASLGGMPAGATGGAPVNGVGGNAVDGSGGAPSQQAGGSGGQEPSSGGSGGSGGSQAAGGGVGMLPSDPGCAVQKQWYADFTSDPTQLDVNEDNVLDWRLRNGAPFPVGELAGGRWLASPNTVLDTAPFQDFEQRVVAEVHLRHSGAADDNVPAALWINVDNANTQYISVAAMLRRVSSSEQRLSLINLRANSNVAVLTRVDDLPTGIVKVVLDIQPKVPSVRLFVEGRDEGEYELEAGLSQPKDPYATLWSGNGGAEYDFVAVTLCNP
jgi:hypothetical protein